MPWQEPLDDAAATLCRGPDSRGALRQLADVDNGLLSSCATRPATIPARSSFHFARGGRAGARFHAPPSAASDLGHAPVNWARLAIQVEVTVSSTGNSSLPRSAVTSIRRLKIRLSSVLRRRAMPASCAARSRSGMIRSGILPPLARRRSTRNTASAAAMKLRMTPLSSVVTIPSRAPSGIPRKRRSLSHSAETAWSCAIATQSAPPSRDVSTSGGCQQVSSTQSLKPSPPPGTGGHDRNAHVRFNALHCQPFALILWKLAHPAIRHLPLDRLARTSWKGSR